MKKFILAILLVLTSVIGFAQPGGHRGGPSGGPHRAAVHNPGPSPRFGGPRRPVVVHHPAPRPVIVNPGYHPAPVPHPIIIHTPGVISIFSRGDAFVVNLHDFTEPGYLTVYDKYGSVIITTPFYGSYEYPGCLLSGYYTIEVSAYGRNISKIIYIN